MALLEVERKCLAAIRAGEPPELSSSSTSEERFLGVGLSLLLRYGWILRLSRQESHGREISFKEDGTPATRIEHGIEMDLRESLKMLMPAATIVGEETGGTLPVNGSAVAIDPVDGTWSFLSRTESHVTTLCLFEDAQPRCGMVMNPSTAEIGHVVAGRASRLLQVSAFGEPDIACNLPLDRVKPESVLVNFHPQRSSALVQHRLQHAWEHGRVRMVRSPGGSPAWSLLEAARGSFVYANLWDVRQACPWDLAAAALLVIGAGGSIVDVDGALIDPVSHAGPFIAGVDGEAVALVASLIRDATSAGGLAP